MIVKPQSLHIFAHYHICILSLIPNTLPVKTLLNNYQLNLTLQRLAHQLVENHLSFKDTAIIGIQPRGILLSNRIAAIVKEITGNKHIDYGKLDITFYRDDVQSRDIQVPSDTDMPF